MYHTLHALLVQIGLSKGDCHPELPNNDKYKALGRGGGAICLEEALFLGGVMAITKPDVVIELGSAWGGSALALGAIAKDILPRTVVKSIDMAPKMPDITLNLVEALGINVDFISANSHEWLEQYEVDPSLTYFCFSDTEIDQRPREVNKIREKFPKGTFICVHDTSDLHPVGPMKLYDKVEGPMLEMPSPRGLTILKV